MSEFFIGASYYPEWWTPAEWEADFAKMQALGFNVVRMGEFAWSWYEPEEGRFCFEPMHRAMDIAHRHGIKVILGTTTAVCPPWLFKKYPEVKGGNLHGHYHFGGRKGQCLSNDVFLSYAQRITEEQAKALGSHPALIGWQLDNEPGFPFNDFDEHCRDGFREWLKEKYKTIDALNRAWFTMMWSNVYTDFDEIDIPVNSSEGGWTPEVQLDYRKYFSFTFNRLLSMEAKIVRRHSPGRFLYTNWPGANWSVNCFEGSTYMDYAAWDNYVGQPHGEAYRVQLRASFEHSFDRSLSCGKGKFLVAEQKAYVNANQLPEVIRAQTWLNVSHGAFGTVYFEWRTPRGGAEQEYGSVLGRDKKVRPETEPVYKKLTEEIRRIYPLLDGAQTESKIAVVYSYENSWGSRGWVVDGPYDEELFNAYGGFKNKLGTDVDVIGMNDDFSSYKIIVLPNHRITTEEQAKRLEEFVFNGGIVVMNTECGTRDEANLMRELNQPGLFRAMCGAEAAMEISESELKAETGERGHIAYESGLSSSIGTTMHTLRLFGAKVVAVYQNGRMNGEPAVSVNAFGDGYAVLYGSDGNDVYFYEALADYVKTQFGIEPLLKAEDGILLSSRRKGDKTYLFAVNMKDRPVKLFLDRPMTELLTNRVMNGEVEVSGYDTLVLE